MYKELVTLIASEKARYTGALTARFARQLKSLRLSTGLSQRELAKNLGVPESTYANWEQGRREPSIFDIYNILYTLGIDANELFDAE